MKRKGFVFTMDVLLGLSLLLITLAVFYYFEHEAIFPEKKYEKLSYVADDVMVVLSHATVEDLKEEPTIKKLISENVIKQEDLNKTILDLIASFWYAGNESIARNISADVLSEIDFCLNLSIETGHIYSSCNETGKDIAVSARIETGYEVGKPTYGYIARAFLTSIKSKTTSSYAYFGGFVGEGNISRNISLPVFESIEGAYMELDVGGNFTLYINGNYSGFYTKGSAGGGNMTADKWQINSSYLSYFKEGNNILTFEFVGDKHYIGGGYFRVTYNTSQLAPEEEFTNKKYWFPGINGFINLYSSFYVPGDLNSMTIYLHYKNNYPTFLNVGGVNVFESNETGEQIIVVNNSILSSLLSYENLSKKTIPIRLGTKTFLGATGSSDVILVTDMSGSMDWRLDSDISGVERSCDDPNLYDPSTKRISLAKCLDKQFVDIILNVSGNRVGLVGFYGDADPPYKGRTIAHDLSTNKTSLYNEIDNYFTQDGTCICCAINRAYNILNEQSNATRKKFIVVMSDGIPTHQCGSAGVDECEGTRDGSPGNEGLWLGFGSGCYGGADDCDTVDCLCAMQNANWSSCRVHNDLNTTVYSIGFGPVADCWSANWTLQAVANCGGGKYAASNNATELRKIYTNVASEIVEITYLAQTVNMTEEAAWNNILYPDSYIEFNYTPIVIPYEYGEISLTRETPRLRNFTGDDIDIPYKEGWFVVSNKTKVVDAKVTSYSSEYWTDRLYVKNETGNWTRVYWLEGFGKSYQELGDPYIVQIPINLISFGNNSVRIGTGFSPENATGGSPDDKIIYEIRVKGSVGYGKAFNSSELAINDAIERLKEEVKDFVDIEEEDIATESKTLKGIRWLWGPSLIKVVVWERGE